MVGGRFSSFELRDYTVNEARLRLQASDGSEFILDVNAEGLKFFSSESSSGQSHEKPVVVTVDELWEMFGKRGDRVALKDRAKVVRSRRRNSKLNLDT